MKDEQARPQEKTIRFTVPAAIYPRLAFLAAQAGVSVPAFVRATVIARVVELAFLFRDGGGRDPAADHEATAADRAEVVIRDQGDDFKLPGDHGAAVQDDEEHDPLDDL